MAGLDVCEKSRPPPGSDPRTVQPVASRYTDWAIPAHTFIFRVDIIPPDQAAVDFSETSGNICQAAWHNIPEDSHRHQNLTRQKLF
jgi:hypothetical protein